MLLGFPWQRCVALPGDFLLGELNLNLNLPHSRWQVDFRFA